MMAKMIPTYDAAMRRFKIDGKDVFGAYTTRTRAHDHPHAKWAEIVYKPTEARHAISTVAKEEVVKAEIEKQTGARVTQVWYDP